LLSAIKMGHKMERHIKKKDKQSKLKSKAKIDHENELNSSNKRQIIKRYR
jgi:hypothetical protein